MDHPTTGGSFVRDPVTGALTPEVPPEDLKPAEAPAAAADDLPMSAETKKGPRK